MLYILALGESPLGLLAVLEQKYKYSRERIFQTLYILAFGESVINDAVSIVLFESILSQYYINQVTYLL